MDRLLIVALATCGGFLPAPGPVRDSVDTAEQSFVYDGEGRLVLTQVIFWQGSNVVAWRMVKDGEPCIRRDWKHGGYVCRWQDKETFREVRSKHEMVTHEQFDRELVAREVLPVCNRRELTPCRAGRRK